MVSTPAPGQKETKIRKKDTHAKEAVKTVKDEKKSTKSLRTEAKLPKTGADSSPEKKSEMPRKAAAKNHPEQPVRDTLKSSGKQETKGLKVALKDKEPSGEKPASLTGLFTARQNQNIVAPAPKPVSLPVKENKAEEDLNFSEGDYVVYPTHGVGKVDRIVTENIAGQTLQLVVVTFSENHMTLRVPVHKAQSSGLRKLSSRKQFDEALAILKGKAKIRRIMWSRRAQEYEAKINSGSPIAVAEVIRDLHRNVNQPDQSFSERQIFEAALDRLATEYAAIKKISKILAAEELLTFIKSAPVVEIAVDDPEEEGVDDLNLHIAEAL